MSAELYSTEDVARRLGLHVRTVRGYVRDGRLRATRIGKQYRVARADLEAFFGSPVPERSDAPPPRHVDVSSVVAIDAVSRETADRVSALLTAMPTHAGDQPLRVETAYDEARQRMKIIVLGGLTDTRQLLESVQAVLES